MIIQNQVKCYKCGDSPFSAHRHDFKICSCGAIAVDGGLSYLKRVGSLSGYQELSIEMGEEVIDDLKKEIKKAEERRANELGIICAVMRVLRDHGYSVSETPSKR